MNLKFMLKPNLDFLTHKRIMNCLIFNNQSLEPI